MKSCNIARPFLSKVFMLILILFAGTTIATTNSYFSNIKVSYDSGDSYLMTIKDDSVMWKGLTGEDKDLVSNNHAKHIIFSKDIDVFQWTDEKTKVFVTLMLNKKNHEAICSSKSTENKEWFLRGKISNQ